MVRTMLNGLCKRQWPSPKGIMVNWLSFEQSRASEASEDGALFHGGGRVGEAEVNTTRCGLAGLRMTRPVR